MAAQSIIRNGRILTAQMAEDLAWMSEQDETDAFVRKTSIAEDERVARLRQRQSDMRRAASGRGTGTSLTASESTWLFRDAVIVEISNT